MGAPPAARSVGGRLHTARRRSSSRRATHYRPNEHLADAGRLTTPPGRPGGGPGGPAPPTPSRTSGAGWWKGPGGGRWAAWGGKTIARDRCEQFVSAQIGRAEVAFTESGDHGACLFPIRRTIRAAALDCGLKGTPAPPRRHHAQPPRIAHEPARRCGVGAPRAVEEHQRRPDVAGHRVEETDAVDGGGVAWTISFLNQSVIGLAAAHATSAHPPAQAGMEPSIFPSPGRPSSRARRSGFYPCNRCSSE